MRHTYNGTPQYHACDAVMSEGDDFMERERRAKCAPAPRGSLDAANQVRDAIVNAAAKVRDEQGKAGAA